MSVGWLRDLLVWADWAILTYFMLFNTSYLILIALAAGQFVHRMRRVPIACFDETYRSPLTPAISVVVPAYNEAAGIIESTRAMLALRYPVFEVVLVDDGSTDSMFELLRAEYDLVEVERVIPDAVPTRGAVRSVHVPRLRPEPLVVVRKANGGRADALNVGINAARHPLVCMTDADSILDSQALLAVAKPFVDDPLRTVGAGGVVRVANGCTVLGGRVVDVRMPGTWLPRIQVVEHLRAFLLGRTGWSRIDGLLVVSSAFGLFKRDAIIDVGGLDGGCADEDAELVVRLHEKYRREKKDYRIRFVGEPVCWTEAPPTARVLGRQRRRWQRGICEIMWKHRRMIGNPRYGRVGLLALPYCLVFEALAPVMEIAGLVITPIAYLVGAIDAEFALRLLIVVYGYAIVVNLVALAVEEDTVQRYARWRDLAIAAAASVLENVGFRQLHTVWRLKGIWDLALRRPAVRR